MNIVKVSDLSVGDVVIFVSDGDWSKPAAIISADNCVFQVIINNTDIIQYSCNNDDECILFGKINVRDEIKSIWDKVVFVIELAKNN